MDTPNKKNAPEHADKVEDELKEEYFELDLPDVKDIPGQEHVHPPDLREMADTTVASDDEEGSRIFEDDEVESVRLNREEVNQDFERDLSNTELPQDISDFDESNESDLTEQEEEALEQTGSDDDESLRLAEVDETDNDGEPLNEKNEENDLDIPGAEEDDEDEEIGKEDEENNDYSVADEE